MACRCGGSENAELKALITDGIRPYTADEMAVQTTLRPRPKPGVASRELPWKTP